MFVGKYLLPSGYRTIVDSQCTGAAVGGLGRHTQFTPDGIPVFDGRMEILFKVSHKTPKRR